MGLIPPTAVILGLRFEGRETMRNANQYALPRRRHSREGGNPDRKPFVVSLRTTYPFALSLVVGSDGMKAILCYQCAQWPRGASYFLALPKK